MLTTPAVDAPDASEVVVIGFEKGTPVSVNGERMNPVALLTALNLIGGRHGVGVIDLVEDRLVGMKSRGVYESPGGSLVYAAHSELGEVGLERRTPASLGPGLPPGSWRSHDRLAAARATRCAQAVGRPLQRRIGTGVRRAQQLDRHRLSTLAVRRAVLESLGHGLIWCGCDHAVGVHRYRRWVGQGRAPFDGR